MCGQLIKTDKIITYYQYGLLIFLNTIQWSVFEYYKRKFLIIFSHKHIQQGETV